MTDREIMGALLVFVIWLAIAIFLFTTFGGFSLIISIPMGISAITGWINEGKRIEEQRRNNKNDGDM